MLLTKEEFTQVNCGSKKKVDFCDQQRELSRLTLIEIATSISCQENLLKTGIALRGLVSYFLSWAFSCKQQVQVKDPEEAEGLSRRRAAERRKRRSELLENAIKDKMLKIDELGETIEEIPFSDEEGLDENPEKD